MPTTYTDIASWLYSIQAQNAGRAPKGRKIEYVLIVCDTFDYTDYCVHVYQDEDIWQKIKYYNNSQRMSSVMEVYDMKNDIQAQLRQRRAWSVPRNPLTDKSNSQRAQESTQSVVILRRSTWNRRPTQRFKPYN